MGWLYPIEHRCHGAVEEFLRMPVSGTIIVIISRFQCVSAHGHRCKLVVMVVGAMIWSAAMVMVRIAIIVAVDVDVQVVAAGVVVEVKPGARRCERRERERQRGPLSQSCAYPPHGAGLVPHTVIA